MTLAIRFDECQETLNRNFEVLNAQLAGCAGAIVYDNVPESLIVMYSTRKYRNCFYIYIYIYI